VGRVAELLEWALNTNGAERPPEVKGDPGGLATMTADHYAPAGYDAQPLPGDYFATHDGPATGEDVVSGYHDPRIDRKAGPGETRLYSRAGPGGLAAEMWCKRDGTVEISSLLPLSKIILNGVEIDTEGNVTVPGFVTAAGEITAQDVTPITAVGLSTHMHNTAMGPTSPPTGGT